MSNPNPKFLKPHAGLTTTQRKSLGLGEPCKPREREPNEATSIVICNASTKQQYRTGQGDSMGVIRL